MAAVAPLVELWRQISLAQVDMKLSSSDNNVPDTATISLIPLTRIGLGGQGTGSPFHEHPAFAVALAFYGSKTWLIARPDDPDEIGQYRSNPQFLMILASILTDCSL